MDIPIKATVKSTTNNKIAKVNKSLKTFFYIHCTKNEFFHYGFLQETADLVTFTENIFNGKLEFLCSGSSASVRVVVTTLSRIFHGFFGKKI